MNKLQQQTKTNRANRSSGFTIIEVVLVLAIAGLIFLMVFIALPSLQRSQRDTQRKQDLSRIQTQITSYANNNRGTIPTDLTSGTKSFVQNYLGGTSKSIAGTSYVDPTTGTGYEFQAAGTQPSAVGQIGYKAGATCGTDGAFSTGTARQYAVEVYLEGQSVPYCVDSQ